MYNCYIILCTEGRPPHMDGGYDVCTPKQNVSDAERGLTSYPGTGCVAASRTT